jgi:hypothetical protein
MKKLFVAISPIFPLKSKEQLAICEDLARKTKTDVRQFFTACTTLLLVVTTQHQTA